MSSELRSEFGVVDELNVDTEIGSEVGVANELKGGQS